MDPIQLPPQELQKKLPKALFNKVIKHDWFRQFGSAYTHAYRLGVNSVNMWELYIYFYTDADKVNGKVRPKHMLFYTLYNGKIINCSKQFRDATDANWKVVKVLKDVNN